MKRYILVLEESLRDFLNNDLITTEGRSLVARTYDVQYISCMGEVLNCHLQKYMKSDAQSKPISSTTSAKHATAIDDSGSDECTSQFWVADF